MSKRPEQFEDAAGSQDDIYVEAAQVIISLPYGAGSLLLTSPTYTHPCAVRFLEALRGLPHANIHQAFLYAISRFGPSEPDPTKAAFSRAFRAIAIARAELVVPSQSGLRND